MELIFHYGFIAGSLAWEYFLTRKRRYVYYNQTLFNSFTPCVISSKSR